MKSAFCPWVIGRSTRQESLWCLGKKSAGWLGPGAALVLLPKCPACVAAYVGVVTGFGISLSAASQLRVVIILVCLASLAFVAGKRLRRFSPQSAARRRGQPRAE